MKVSVTGLSPPRDLEPTVEVPPHPTDGAVTNVNPMDIDSAALGPLPSPAIAEVPDSSPSSTSANTIAGRKRPLEDPGDHCRRVGPIPAQQATTSNVLTEEERTRIQTLMPTLSYTTMEDASIAISQDMSSEFPIGEAVAIYDGRVVFQVTYMSESKAREPYIPTEPWDEWRTVWGISTARVLLNATSLSGDVKEVFLDTMPMKLLAKLYAAAVFIP